MKNQVHMTASLRGILQQPDKALDGLFIDDDGREIPGAELRELAVQKLREGFDVMPVCDNFDSRGYCKGHPIKEDSNHENWFKKFLGRRPKLVFAIDGDGTLWPNFYPEIKPVYRLARKIIPWMSDRGHSLVFWTCRNHVTMDLEPALQHLANNHLHEYFIAFNEGVPCVMNKFGGNPRKIGADIYFDDKAFFPGWFWVPIIVLWLEWKYRKGGNLLA